MTVPDQVDKLMSDLWRRHGWTAPRADADGRYSLVVDAGMEISIFQVGRELFFESPVGRVPDDREARETLMSRMLRSQLARVGRRSDVLCLEPDGPGLVLYRRMPVSEVDLRVLEEALGAFANSVDFWSRESFGAGTKPTRTFQPAMRMWFP
jgi:hypothetical protein